MFSLHTFSQSRYLKSSLLSLSISLYVSLSPVHSIKMCKTHILQNVCILHHEVRFILMQHYPILFAYSNLAFAIRQCFICAKCTSQYERYYRHVFNFNSFCVFVKRISEWCALYCGYINCFSAKASNTYASHILIQNATHKIFCLKQFGWNINDTYQFLCAACSMK